MKNIAILLIALLISLQCQSQELERRGTFGVHMENSKSGKGIQVLKVIENSTASSIGLKEGDIILKVNGKTYNDINTLIRSIDSWYVNNPISVTVKRGNKNKILKGNVVGKPYETSDHGKIIYGHVDYDGGKLRSILELPNNVENPPVIFFLPGIGCGSLDFYYNPSNVIKLLVESFVEKGIAVYRVEKPGMGDSKGTKDCLEMDFNYEVAAFDTALKKLKTIKGIDNKNIFLYGHSLGAVSAPLIASKNDVAGIISWGGLSTSWFEYALESDKDQQIIFGTDYEELEDYKRRVTPFRYEFLVEKKTPEELSKNPDYKEFVGYFQNGVLWHGVHHYSYFHTLNEINILTAYKNANCPVLAVAGEYDYHAINPSWAKDIADTVNYYLPNEGEYIVIPKTSHHYHTVPSPQIYNQLRASGKINGAYMAQNFNYDIPLVISNWVKKNKV